jgi:hypothetical protein
MGGATVVTVGGIDTYYDYDEQLWKYRRLGGGPIHDEAADPVPAARTAETDASRRVGAAG